MSELPLGLHLDPAGEVKLRDFQAHFFLPQHGRTQRNTAPDSLGRPVAPRSGNEENVYGVGSSGPRPQSPTTLPIERRFA
jgi:hypothetical protein